MQGSDIKVSVVIPVYNSASTLRRAVNSVRQQTMQHIEIIIINDGSTDGSLALAHELALTDSRINVLSLPTNNGKPRAMNTAIREARGTWIAVLDADDWYEPNRLHTLLTAAQSSGVELVADNQYFHDAHADHVVGTAFPPGDSDRPFMRQNFVTGSNPYASFDYGMLKPVVNADFARQSGLTYRENARLGEDFLYLVEFFAAGGTGVLVTVPLYHWTQPFGSISRMWTTTGAGPWRYDYQSGIDAQADVLRRLRDRQDRDLVKLLHARTRAFRKLHHLNRISRMRAAGASKLHILQTVSQIPAIWPLLARRLFQSS